MKLGVIRNCPGVTLFYVLSVLLLFTACGGEKEDSSPEGYKEYDGGFADAENRIETLKASLYEDPDNFQLLSALGDAYFESQRYNEAVKEYEKALKIDPTNSDCLNDMGLALFYTGNSEAALESFEKATDADSSYVYSWLSKGFVLMSLGRYEEAELALNKVQELDPLGKLGEEADNFLAQIGASKGQI